MNRLDVDIDYCDELVFNLVCSKLNEERKVMLEFFRLCWPYIILVAIIIVIAVVRSLNKSSSASRRHGDGCGFSERD